MEKNKNVVHTKSKKIIKQENNIYKKDNGKKKVSFYIVLVLIVFWTICGFLSIFNTAKSCDNVAYADELSTSTSFSGSNIMCNAVIKNKFELYNLDLNNEISIDIGLSYNSNNQLVMSCNFLSAYSLTKLSPLADNIQDVNGYSFSNVNKEIVLGTNNVTTTNVYNVPFDNINQLYQVFFGFNAGEEPQGANYLLFRDNFLLTLYILKDVDFNLNLVKVELGSYNFWQVGDFFGDKISANYIRYIDVNGNSLYLIIPIISNPQYAGGFLFSNRTYYITTDFSSDEYYQEGYEIGKAQGIAQGKQEGYQDGYNRGNSDGYNRGYNAGAEGANNYTFLGLIGAVVDAPIQAITGLLSFEILGVDMSNFFFGLISIAIIIFVVRIFI